MIWRYQRLLIGWEGDLQTSAEVFQSLLEFAGSRASFGHLNGGFLASA